MTIQGCIVALITPFTKDGKHIDECAVCALVERLIQKNVEGILVAGTTGEGPTLSDEELSLLVKVVMGAVNGRTHVMVNVGTNDTKKSVERAKIAKKYKCQSCLAVVPYYNKPTFPGICAHFQAIASVGVPLVVYHHPPRTGISLSAEQLVTIHKLEGVVAIKDSGTDPKLTKQICCLYKKAQIFAGNDDLAIDVIQNGGIGCICVLANLLPQVCKEMIEKARKKDFEGAKACYTQVEPLLNAINLEVNPQGIKYAMHVLGLCENQLRLPMMAASESTKQVIRQATQGVLDSLISVNAS